jgi:hypothetical protein
MENVKEVQARYKSQPLSAYLEKLAPRAPPAIEFSIDPYPQWP